MYCLASSEQGFPGGSAGKESACNAGDMGSIPELGRSPGEGKGYPLQYSWASLVAQLVKKPPAMRETWVQSQDWDLEQLLTSVVSDSVRPHRRQPTRLPHPWDSPGQNTGVGSLSLLQGIFPTQGSNPGLPHCRQILYQLSHKGKQQVWPLINA